MRTLEQQIYGRCKHFNGTSKGVCEAGVEYRSVRDESKQGSRAQYPCFREGECLACASRSLPTAEEAKAQANEIESHSAKMLAGLYAAKSDASAKGLKKGNGGQSECKCPVCEGGTIKYSVASINGHMWAKCTTDKCCAWME